MEQRANIKFCFKLGKKFAETYELLNKVYKHRVLGFAILHPGNTHALIEKFCNYVLGRTSFREWMIV